MSVKIVTEQVEKDVTMMTQPEAHFVSLVKHGANRMPFRVIKSQKGGEDLSMSMVVQSILVPKGSVGPKGAELEKLIGLKGNEWLAEASVEKAQAHEDYVRLEQVPAAKMDSSSMQMIRLPGGALALVGKLQPDSGVKNALTVNTQQVQKDGDAVPAAPFHAPLQVEDQIAGGSDDMQLFAQALGPTFADLFFSELDSMVDIVIGSMKQSAGDIKSRKKTILAAVDAFRQFLATSLDILSPEAAKSVAEKFEPLTRALKSVKCYGALPPEEKGKKKGGTEDMAMFESKEEFLAAVKGVVKGEIDAFKAELAQKAKKPPVNDDDNDLGAGADAAAGGNGKEKGGKKPKAEGDPIISDPNVAPTDTMMPNKEKLERALVQLQEGLNALKTEVAAIASKTEKLGEALTSERPGAGEDPPEGARKDVKKDERRSIFRGLLTGETLDREGVRQQFGA